MYQGHLVYSYGNVNISSQTMHNKEVKNLKMYLEISSHLHFIQTDAISSCLEYRRRNKFRKTHCLHFAVEMQRIILLCFLYTAMDKAKPKPKYMDNNFTVLTFKQRQYS